MAVGLPREVAEWLALLVALVLVAVAMWPPRASPPVDGAPRAFKAVCAACAAALSALYIVSYLRGGPRIVDATTYFLEGRLFSEGRFSWNVGDVPASTMGRFAVRDTLGTGLHATGIFPPGYPALLALGFVVGAPMAVGPILAAIIVLLTLSLAKEAARHAGALSVEQRGSVPKIAGLLSVVCAALRYHTADTMSHGLAAACLTAALACALRLRPLDAARAREAEAASSAHRREPFVASAMGLGLALGVLFATRPVSAVAGSVLVLIALGRRVLSIRLLSCIVLGASAPVALFVIEQHAATGGWLASSQSLYYAVSDGPSGCFAYGFGEHVGCRIEHGDFVEHNLPHGYGAIQAVATTLRRLEKHLGDPLNAAPLALIVAVAMTAAIRNKALRALALSLPVFALLYAPFYFDGNYPGGGARFFADQLPVEHVLVALFVPTAASWLSERRGGSRIDPSRLGLFVVAASAAGFAFFAGHEHALLREREGGQPMFEESEMRRAGVSSGLVFVDTDHGFDLGFDPQASVARGIEVVRFRGDANDRWAWEARGKPPAFRYLFSFAPAPTERVSILPFEPPESVTLEAESSWPPLAQWGGYALPAFHGCASGGRWLRLVRTEPSAGFRIALPKEIGGARVVPRVAVDTAAVGPSIGGSIQIEADGKIARRWAVPGHAMEHHEECEDASLFDLEPADIDAGAASYALVFGAEPAESDRSRTAFDATNGPLLALDALRVEKKR